VREFPYRAFDPSGWPQRGVVTAETWQEAFQLLEEEGLTAIAPDGAQGQRWAWQQEIGYLRRQIDWLRLARVAALVALALVAVYLLIQWLGSRTIQVEGVYQVEGVRGPLYLSFSVDGHRVSPKASKTKVSRNRYSSELRFFSLWKPKMVRVRLRMKGYDDVSHVPIPIPEASPPKVVFPGLVLRPKVPSARKSN
jgi:hypothetical protein